MSLYTIGHSTQTQKEFLERLKMYDIDYLLDVRSTPFSKYTSQFNKDILSTFLSKNNIWYYPMGAFFGARPTDKSLYTQDGYLDFEKTRESEVFKKGLNNVVKGLNSGHRIALMCTEKDPLDCHRAILVGRGFELAGVCVSHIHMDGNLETQQELNKRVLTNFENKKKINTKQILLFQEQKSEEEWLIDAYRFRNREIGYNYDNGELVW